MNWTETGTSDAFIEKFDSVSRGANELLVVKPGLVTAVLVLFVRAHLNDKHFFHDTPPKNKIV